MNEKDLELEDLSLEEIMKEFGDSDDSIADGQEILTEPDIRRQLDTVMQQYQQMQQTKPQ